MTPHHHTPTYIYVMIAILWVALAFGAFFYEEIDLLKLSLIVGFSSVTALWFVIAIFELKPNRKEKFTDTSHPYPEVEIR